MPTKKASDSAGTPLLTIQNHHIDPAPPIAIDEEMYVSYFESSIGDQWVFTRRRGAETGCLYGGDLGWGAVEIRDPAPASIEKKRTRLERVIGSRLDPLVPELILAPDERAWLNMAWWASSRHGSFDEERAAIVERVLGQLPEGALGKHPNTHEHRSAMAALAFLIGQAAGIRGMDDEHAGALMEAAVTAAGKRQQQ